MSTIQIPALAQDIASAVVVVAHDDLRALASIHGQLQELVRNLPADVPAGDGARETALKAEKLVEQIVLGEVSNAEEAVKRLNETISSLMGSVAPGLGGEQKRSAIEEERPPGRAARQVDAERLNPGDLALVAEFISEASGHIESAETALLRLEGNPEDSEAVNIMFRGFHTIKGVAGFLNLKAIGELADAGESLLDLARHGTLRVTGAAVDAVLEAIDLMKGMLGALAESMKAGMAPGAPEGLAEVVERLGRCANGLEMRAKPQAAKVGAAVAAENVVRVSTERLDSLTNAIGELVIAQSMVRQDITELAAGNQRLARNLNQLGKIARELQDLSMAMRMVPIAGVFQKMNRLVRDLGRKAVKEMDLVAVGGETELDRNLVEAISDPLVHMIRNAADHGIESPDERERAGKPRMGRIELKAYHAAGNIVVEISDDGKGLAKSKILQKAIEAGIVGAEQTLGEQEIFKLIFHPGLSTAAKVTEVSGRGVGMDVVRKNVEALRGRIDITSTEGKGSTFTLRLPLTLAVIDGLVVKVGAERFIVPILSVEQSLRPTADQISTLQGRAEMCMVRDSLLPLYRMHRLFEIEPKEQDPTAALLVIVQDDSRRCALMVDELLGQQQVVIKSLSDGVGAVRGVSGGAILGDGNVSLILDVPGLIDLATGTRASFFAEKERQ